MSAADTVVTQSRSGLRKAAILLIQVGRDNAAQVLAKLSDREVEELTAEIARLDALTQAETDHVLTEFRDMMVARGHISQGGLSFAQSLLEESMGPERAAEIMDRLNAAAVQLPFQFLHRADPAQLRSFIADEHPQIIALVIAHMTADKGALLLSGLEPKVQTDVAYRLAVMDRTSPEVVAGVEKTLERKLSSMLQPTEMSRVGGVDPLVEIINRSDRSTERLIVEGLEGKDSVLADEVKSRMFIFDDLVFLDDRSMQLVLRQIDTATLALSLKGVSEAVRAKVVENLSSGAATTLLEEVEILGAVRLRQVEEAQQVVIRKVRELEEAGQIIVRRGGGGDEEIVL